MKSYNELAYEVVKVYGFESIESLLNSDLDINKKQDFIYDLVVKAQKECIKAIKIK